MGPTGSPAPEAPADRPKAGSLPVGAGLVRGSARRDIARAHPRPASTPPCRSHWPAAIADRYSWGFCDCTVPLSMPAGAPLYDREDVPRHWDEYYSDPANLDFAPSPLVVQIAEVVRPGRA